jgi:diadenosine tetraphosphate (Ap4A) HIT family hydrolase
MAWFADGEWEQMCSGATCPLCADAYLPTNPHSDLVAELSMSYVRLAKNQTHAGYMIVVLKYHAVELHDLPLVDRSAFADDVARVGRSVERLFGPVKLDTLIMGHLCPHGHCHVYPRYHHDDPRKLINVQEGDVSLSEGEARERIAQIRLELAQTSS